MWKGRLKRRNYFIFILILCAFFALLNNYLPDTVLLSALSSVLTLIIALYMLCLSIRRAQDIGIRKGGVKAITVFYGAQILIGLVLAPASILGYISFFTTLVISSLINIISLPIGLYLLCADSEKKDNVYGVYEEKTKKSFIDDILNR